MELDPGLLEILRCPESRTPLVQDGATLVSTDPTTRRRYAIEHGIPNLVREDGEELDAAEWRRIMVRHGVLTDDTSETPS